MDGGIDSFANNYFDETCGYVDGSFVRKELQDQNYPRKKISNCIQIVYNGYIKNGSVPLYATLHKLYAIVYNLVYNLYTVE